MDWFVQRIYRYKAGKKIYMKDYHVIIGSPVDYEELTADIVINDIYIARVQMENGRDKDKMVLEFFEETALQKVKLSDFLNAIADAVELLLK